MPTAQEVDVLLVEDDEVDIESIIKSFKKNHFNARLHITKNGVEALNFLLNKKESFLIPKLIILDINMPKMNGFEFLMKLRSDNDLKSIAVIILTASNNNQDKLKAKQFNVIAYLVKPLHFEDLITHCRPLFENFP